MQTKRTENSSKKRAWFEEDCIIIEGLSQPKNTSPNIIINDEGPDDENTNAHKKNAFDELLNKEKSDSSNLIKEKGGLKLRSWIYNWGERKSHPTDSKKYIFKCNQK